ncbi:MAG: hypothetical protein LBJ92_01350 [Holosporales bacterium]|jgi:hypothetical protein|nr:hypothetical protein [Holosporales bacterium]
MKKLIMTLAILTRGILHTQATTPDETPTAKDFPSSPAMDKVDCSPVIPVPPPPPSKDTTIRFGIGLSWDEFTSAERTHDLPHIPVITGYKYVDLSEKEINSSWIYVCLHHSFGLLNDYHAFPVFVHTLRSHKHGIGSDYLILTLNGPEPLVMDFRVEEETRYSLRLELKRMYSVVELSVRKLT